MTTEIVNGSVNSIYVIRGDTAGRDLISSLRINHDHPGRGSEYLLVHSSFYVAYRNRLEGTESTWEERKSLYPRRPAITARQMVRRIIEHIGDPDHSEQVSLGDRLIVGSIAIRLNEPGITYNDRPRLSPQDAIQMMARAGRVRRRAEGEIAYDVYDEAVPTLTPTEFQNYVFGGWGASVSPTRKKTNKDYNGIRAVYRHGL